jgi:hypothetical protein
MIQSNTKLKKTLKYIIICYTAIRRIYVNGVTLFHNSHLITLMAYPCSRWIPNVQIKYFTFDRSIYRLFELNWAWKRVSLQIMIFVYICLAWIIVELNTCFETWITRNDVNGVSLFNLSYLISVTVTCANNGHQMWKSLYYIRLFD